ncbi:MAG: amino acid ABC transporter permease [Lachnospiraceae bacterium]|nr:amino acid ABC transporter permease [Lachnospiraceae bacterium]
MSFDGKVFVHHFIELLPYLRITFYVTFLSIMFSLALGAVTAAGILSRNVLWRGISKGYVNLMRCVPPIVLLFVVYYGGPMLVKNLTGADIDSWDAVYFAIIALSLLHGAGMAEMMRGAYQAVDRGQMEAAVSVGLTPVQGFYRIVLPQAVVVAIPVLGNATVSMLKDGALAYSIGVVDVTGQTGYLISMNLGAYVMETYLALALIYWILSLGTQKAFGSLTRRLQKGGPG